MLWHNIQESLCAREIQRLSKSDKDLGALVAKHGEDMRKEYADGPLWVGHLERTVLMPQMGFAGFTKPKADKAFIHLTLEKDLLPPFDSTRGTGAKVARKKAMDVARFQQENEGLRNRLERGTMQPA
jgi:hypothetical protein